MNKTQKPYLGSKFLYKSQISNFSIDIKNNEIPIINDINRIDKNILEDLINKGVAFVKMPNSYMINDLEIVNSHALNFFRSNETSKEEYQFNRETFLGYNEYKKKPNQAIINFNFTNEKIPNCFKPIIPTFFELEYTFKYKVGIEILKKIFENFNLDSHFEYFKESLDNNTWIYAYYPKIPKSTATIGLTAHRDFDYLTILYVNKPGLEYYINDEWVPVNVTPGYLLINLSSALKLALGGKVTSGKHRVPLPKEERISIGLFLGSKSFRSIIDYTKEEIVYDRYSKYLGSKFSKNKI